MNVIERQLLGSDLCNSECVERNNIIHPETNVNQIVINENVSLSDWFGGNAEGTFEDYNNMLDWLQANYTASGHSFYTLPNATDTTLGGVIVDTTYLTIQNGILGLNINNLHIPTLDSASFTSTGTLMLGNNTRLPNTFSNSTIEDDTVNLYPLRVDSNNRAGIAIPSSMFAQTQADWNTTDVNSVSYIKNKPVLANVATSGSYNDLKDTPSFSTVGTGVLTINQNNVSVGTFNANATSDTTIDITDTIYDVATSDTLGLIKIGYTKDQNKKPVQLDDNNKAYVDTEQHPTVGGMITNGLSAHFFRVGTGSAAGGYSADNKWIPILISHSNNIGKCSVSFEIYGREDGKTSYGKYYVNHMTSRTFSLLCLSYYSEDTNYFDYDDIRCAKYTVDNNVTIIIYKKVRNVSDSMFIVNILAENSASYSTQHYFYTSSSSIDDVNYKLTNQDYRIGSFDSTNNTITARLENDSESDEKTMTSIGATNGTFYNPNN